ncbi:MAG: response regulator [Anaerolineales bacterium]|nr:response regulator [Anaerolineales bacterium]
MSYLTHATPDLILSDIMMAETDGYTLLDTLRKQNDTKHIPVILHLSGRGKRYGKGAF